MSFNGLQAFVSFLDSCGDLQRIKSYADPSLEITELADRMVKNGGKALLFEDTGTDFPLLINAMASDERIKAAIHRSSYEDAGEEILSLFNAIGSGGGFRKKISDLPQLLRMLKVMPKRISGRGICQEVIMSDVDLDRLPVLKCWPYDGGRFITLPLVHTFHPVTLKTNVGMYRMQVMGPGKTGMHWHRHKTGARHFEAWKERSEKMPVTVTLGGDPVYTYAATAPVPENIDEYILAGFLRHKRVKLVKCLTNDIWVPADSDFVIEGYVDPAEDLVWEGPFGDHTGFYSLADWYPSFHVTCITHRRDAVYPATIVGVPPMEDAWIGKATEKIFLAPMKMAISPEMEDIHLPYEGVAHNLVIVKIKKEYPGQGLKVLSALFGAGQMMFSKYIIAVSGETEVTDYGAVAKCLLENTDLNFDILRLKGPLDVLDHASDSFSFGGKIGIDATKKMPEELSTRDNNNVIDSESLLKQLSEVDYDLEVSTVSGYVIAVISLRSAHEPFNISEFSGNMPEVFHSRGVISILVDEGITKSDLRTVAWYSLANTDPLRDIVVFNGGGVFINAIRKNNIEPSFSRQWPNVVCSDNKTIQTVDDHWSSYVPGDFIQSPSLALKGIEVAGDAVVPEKK